LPPECIGKYPTIMLSTLSDPRALEHFLKVIGWTIEEVKSSAELSE